MILDSVIVSLIIGWAVVCVEANPMPKTIVELSSCGVDASDIDEFLPKDCSEPCRPVVEVQQQCERESTCTCSKVSPLTLQTCILCSIAAPPGSNLYNALPFIPVRLEAYSQLCSHVVSERGVDVSSVNTTAYSLSDVDSTTRDAGPFKREYGSMRCLFGLPEIVEMRYRWPELNQVVNVGPWPVFAFFAVAGLCYAENRRYKASAKSG